MTANAAGELAAERRGRSRVPVTLIMGGMVVVTWVIVALAAPILSSGDPDAIDLGSLLQPPGPGHWFGTDHLGRDVFARVLFGARIDIWMGFMGVLPPLCIGVLIGLFSGYLGGMVDAVMMRLVDITVAFPFFVLVLAIVAMLGPGLTNYFIALAAVAWVAYARLIRAEVLVTKHSEYVLAARTLGYHPLTIIFKHVLPNAFSPIVVYAMTDAVLVILAGASLGFLGMGAQPPTAEWGVMIADGQPYIVNGWWICLFPGLAAMSLGLGFSLIGDGLARVLRVSA